MSERKKMSSFSTSEFDLGTHTGERRRGLAKTYYMSAILGKMAERSRKRYQPENDATEQMSTEDIESSLSEPTTHTSEPV